MSLERVGQYIRGNRKQLKWTQEQLASKAKIDPAYLRRLEAGKQLGSAYSLIVIAKALNIRPGILIDLLADIEPDDEWLKINDPELKIWCNPTNLNLLSRTGRRTISAIIKTELEDHRPLQNGQLVAFVHCFGPANLEGSYKSTPEGVVKGYDTFPAEVAQTLDTVIGQDNTFFENNPDVHEYNRDYVQGEFWPELEEIEPNLIKVQVLKHPKYNLILRVSKVIEEGKITKSLVVRVSYTNEALAELEQNSEQIEAIVDEVFAEHLKKHPDLLDVPVKGTEGVSKNQV